MKAPGIVTGFLFLLCLTPVTQGEVVVNERARTNICQLPQPFYSATQVVPSPSRGFYVTGYHYLPDDGGHRPTRYVTVRYNTHGRGMWTNVVDAGQGAVFPQAIVPDRRGNVVMAGDFGGTRVVVSKYSANGRLIWSNNYEVPFAYRWLSGLAVDSSGAVVVGYSSVTNHPTQYELVKYSANGLPLWTNQLGYAYYEIKTDPAGNIYTKGGALRVGRDEQTVMKFTRAGVPVWTNLLAPAAPERLVVDRFGRAVVACYTPHVIPWGVSVLKYDRDGTLLWFNRPYEIISLLALAVDSRGAVYLAGRSAKTHSQVVVLKTSPRGEPLWSAEVSPEFTGHEMFPRFGRVNPPSATLIQDIGYDGHYRQANASFREPIWWLLR